MSKKLISERAIVILCSYDSAALHLTLESLTMTISNDETVVLILNGKRGLRDAQVESVARKWANKNTNRYVVRPLNYGKDAYNSIKEILEKFSPIIDKKFICKIDDDLIPLKKGWLNELHLTYLEQETKSEVGFVTSLINNNAWGFAELVNIFNKQDEYASIMNYYSTSGGGGGG